MISQSLTVVIDSVYHKLVENETYSWKNWSLLTVKIVIKSYSVFWMRWHNINVFSLFRMWEAWQSFWRSQGMQVGPETSVPGLPDGENCVIVRSLVLSQY